MKTKMYQMMKKGMAGMLAVLTLGSAVLAASPDQDFKIMKSRDGIDLYYRWMVMPEGNRVRQMKAVLEINGSAEEVMNLLKDEKRAVQWISSAEQYKNLTKADGNEWVSYIQFSVPWPLADQDVILEYSCRQETTGETVIDFNCNPDYIEPVDGVSRMKNINGSFVIHSMPDGKCVLECYFLSKKASKIPTWLTDPIITGNILSLMESLRDELTEV